jgi:hypothetical protein
MEHFWSIFFFLTLDPSYRSIYLGIPSDKNPKGQKNIFGVFIITSPTPIASHRPSLRRLAMVGCCVLC